MVAEEGRRSSGLLDLLPPPRAALPIDLFEDKEEEEEEDCGRPFLTDFFGDFFSGLEDFC